MLAHVVDPREAVNEQQFTATRADDARGDAEAALAAAEVTVELALETPAQLQTPLEPHGAVASWDGDHLTAWVSTQGMFSARDELAAAFGLRKDDVRVRTEFVGGGFGGKQGAGFEALAAAELARVTGRPVRLVNDRHAEQLDGGRRVRPGRPSGSARAETARSRRSTPTRSSRWARAAGLPGAHPGPHALPLRRRARADVPRPDEPSPAERIPGARV